MKIIGHNYTDKEKALEIHHIGLENHMTAFSPKTPRVSRG